MGPKQDCGERDGGAFHNPCSCLAVISGPRRPCAAVRAACCPLRLDGCSLPSFLCEQVLPAMIHVVSGWVAVGGHPGAELAPCGAALQGCCSHQGTAWSWGGGGGVRGSPPAGVSTGMWAATFPPAAGIASSSVGFKGVWVALGSELPWCPLAAGRARNPFCILMETLFKPSFQAFLS